MSYNQQGVGAGDEINVNRRRIDTRRTGQKISDLFNSRDGGFWFLGLCFAICALIMFMPIPFVGEISVLVCYVFFKKYFNYETKLFNFPYRLPIQSKLNDGSQAIRIDTNGEKIIPKGNGLFMLGNEIPNAHNGYRPRQVWASNSDLRTHMMIFGTTGSGKTEYILGLITNALIINSGVIMVDGKGDPALQRNVFRLARRFGREDDLLIINFITSGRDLFDKQFDTITNNMNLFGNTSSGMLIELIVSLMDDSGSGGDMWKGRAISFVAALTRVLVFLRDTGHINLSAETYIKYFEMGDLYELCFEHNNRYGEKFEVVALALKTYLKTLPAFQESKKNKQDTKTLEQHGFIVMQLTRIFNDLNFNYGHIFNTRAGEIDFFDVVLNNRILITLLPALERAPDTLKMLGKLIVGNIKQMMASCLGNRVEGLVREIIDSRPTNSPYPTTCILDEYGMYAVVGFAVAPAQARSLGFFVAFAAQDFSAMKKASAEEAEATWENTNIRAVGRMTGGEDAETYKKVKGAAGDAYVSVSTGDDSRMGTLGRKYYSQESVSYEKASRIQWDDLAQQQDGDFTFIIGKKSDGGKRGGATVIMGQGFYAATKNKPLKMRTNTFPAIELPTENDLPKHKTGFNEFKKLCESKNYNPALNSKLQAESNAIISNLSGLLRLSESTSKQSNHFSKADAVFAFIAARMSTDKKQLNALEKRISQSIQSEISSKKAVEMPAADAASNTATGSTDNAINATEKPAVVTSNLLNETVHLSAEQAQEASDIALNNAIDKAAFKPQLFDEHLDDRVFVTPESQPVEANSFVSSDPLNTDFDDDDEELSQEDIADYFSDDIQTTSLINSPVSPRSTLLGGTARLSSFELAIEAEELILPESAHYSSQKSVALAIAANNGQPLPTIDAVIDVELASEKLQSDIHRNTNYIEAPIPDIQAPEVFSHKATSLEKEIFEMHSDSLIFNMDKDDEE